MARPFRKFDSIAGVDIPRRRFTGWAAIYFIAFFVLPVLAVGFALDLALGVVMERGFGLCYSLCCLLG